MPKAGRDRQIWDVFRSGFSPDPAADGMGFEKRSPPILYIWYLLGGCFKIFYVHPSNWGNDPIWRAYFSDGLVQPPTRLPNVVFSGMGTTKRSVESVIQWKKTSQHRMNWMVLWMHDSLFWRKEGKKSSITWWHDFFFEFWAKWLHECSENTILSLSKLWPSIP